MQTSRDSIHRPEVATDGARAFVRAAGSAHSESFAAGVLSRLGSELYGQFADTRQRLLTALVETGGDRHVADIEAGKWRDRLEDLLRTRPAATDDVIALTNRARGL